MSKKTSERGQPLYKGHSKSYKEDYLSIEVKHRYLLAILTLVSNQASSISFLLQADALKEKSSSRIKLSVDIEAPVVLLPLSAASHASFVLDLGRLRVENDFILASSLISRELAGKSNFLSSCGNPAIVDRMKISLSSLQLGKVDDLSKGEGGTFSMGRGLDHVILKPLEVGGEVNRRLSSWCSAVPLVDISLSMEAMKVSQRGGLGTSL